MPRVLDVVPLSPAFLRVSPAGLHEVRMSAMGRWQPSSELSVEWQERRFADRKADDLLSAISRHCKDIAVPNSPLR